MWLCEKRLERRFRKQYGSFKGVNSHSAILNAFQAALTIVFLIPLVATFGQFAYSGFLTRQTPFQILFWPGVEWYWAPSMPVWLLMGVMSVSYIVGIAYMLRYRSLGKVVLWVMVTLIAAKLLGSAVNCLTGWKELQTMSSIGLAGKVNLAIFNLWQNPLWEEVVFRGVPLLLLLSFRKRSTTVSRRAELAYMIVPNVILAIYHVPNHGPSRLIDTFVLGYGLSWLALRYSFFAPLVLHYILDAMIIISISKLPNVPSEEMYWLAQNSTWLNSCRNLAVLAALISIPVTILWNIFYVKKEPVAPTPPNI